MGRRKGGGNNGGGTGKAAADGPAAEPRAVLAGANELPPEKLHGPLPEHPESPDRVASCIARLKGCADLWRALKKPAQRRATNAELQLCHEESHITGLQKLAELAEEDGKPHYVPAHGPVCLSGPAQEVRSDDEGDDTYVTAGSLEAARLAVGGLLQVVDDVMSDSGLQCGLALCRPPGHHASRNRSSGFCLVNNVAVAAAYARHMYPQVRRILIFDWDVHHGQGTQQIFEQDSDVLFVSFQRHDGHTFYPATGNATEVGSGPGRGLTVNVALPEGFGDAALWAACKQVLLPASRSFRPDLILVSAGFDAARGDPIGGCIVAPKAFGLMTREMRRLAAEHAEGRVIFALEGGYNVDVLADCIEEVARALVAEQPGFDQEPFDDAPLWLEGGTCQGAIRRTCEMHRGPPLRLPLPESKKERRRSASRAHASEAAKAPEVQGKALQQPTPEQRPNEQGGSSSSASGRASKGKPAKANNSGQGSSNARPVASIKLEDADLQVCISTTVRPIDVVFSNDELWIWFPQGDAKTSLCRWRVKGILVDTNGPFGQAKFCRAKQQLTLSLRLGRIVGGALELAPFGVE
eukprot:TRINITY_DN33920_c0_g2_i1.p1 TRINITY_DN33920_c0_g2~~TRINITY_DN33920_c0_g2_i1.p1  ORF type:complete len:580 (-),score=124.56 TRINITY_DN33920_c0_g2_i1:27-1766(-)